MLNADFFTSIRTELTIARSRNIMKTCCVIPSYQLGVAPSSTILSLSSLKIDLQKTFHLPNDLAPQSMATNLRASFRQIIFVPVCLHHYVDRTATRQRIQPYRYDEGEIPQTAWRCMLLPSKYTWTPTLRNLPNLRSKHRSLFKGTKRKPFARMAGLAEAREEGYSDGQDQETTGLSLSRGKNQFLSIDHLDACMHG